MAKTIQKITPVTYKLGGGPLNEGPFVQLNEDEKGENYIEIIDCEGKNIALSIEDSISAIWAIKKVLPPLRRE